MGGRVGPSAAAAGGGGGGGGGEGGGGGGGGAGCGGSELGGAASACAPPLLGRRCVRGAFSDPRARGKAGKRVGPGWGQISSGRRRRRGPELASLGGERPGDGESAREPRPAGSARRGGQGGQGTRARAGAGGRGGGEASAARECARSCAALRQPPADVSRAARRARGTARAGAGRMPAGRVT